MLTAGKLIEVENVKSLLVLTLYSKKALMTPNKLITVQMVPIRNKISQ